MYCLKIQNSTSSRLDLLKGKETEVEDRSPVLGLEPHVSEEEACYEHYSKLNSSCPTYATLEPYIQGETKKQKDVAKHYDTLQRKN